MAVIFALRFGWYPLDNNENTDLSICLQSYKNNAPIIGKELARLRRGDWIFVNKGDKETPVVVINNRRFSRYFEPAEE